MDKKTQGQINREWGQEAENIVADWLLTQGYVIRERNWRVGNTIEIDIIAEIPGRIVFVEVKARKGDYVTAYDAVTPAKIKKIVKGADIYLRRNRLMLPYRLDIITVTGTSGDYTIEHMPDAFLPGLG